MWAKLVMGETIHVLGETMWAKLAIFIISWFFASRTIYEPMMRKTHITIEYSVRGYSKI